MALVKKIEISSDTVIGVWKNSESESWLMSQLILSNSETEFIEAIKNKERRQQWLCSRVCLRQLMETDQFIELLADENKKPYIRNFPLNISITHTKDYAAVIMSKSKQVGIDLDKMDPRIEKIAHKFLRPEENKFVTEENKMHSLYLFWCAKEALYKLHGRKLLDFREHIHILDYSTETNGVIHGEIRKSDYYFKGEINYQTFEQHRLAWVCGE